MWRACTAAHGAIVRTRFSYQSILVFLIVGISLFTSFMGMNFGFHWDEGPNYLEPMGRPFPGVLLRGFYNYPSFTYYLAFAGKATLVMNKIFPRLSPISLNLRVRFVFIIASLCSVVLIYLLAVQMLKDRNIAVVSSALLAFSFEFAYHLRWIAPDAVMATMVLLAYLCMFHFMESNSDGSLIATAVCGGLAGGTKYPGGIVLIPVLMACLCNTFLMAKSDEGFRYGLFMRKLLVRGVKVFLAFFISFLITTPGVVLEHKRFMSDIVSQVRYYNTGHGGYTVRNWHDHIMKLIMYLMTASYSSNKIISLVLFLAGAVGVCVMMAKHRFSSLIFLSFPILYALSLSRNIVMVVRNYLVLIPFLCVLSSVGIQYLVTSLRRKSAVLGSLAAFLFGLLIVYNGAFSVKAAMSIRNHARNRGKDVYVLQLNKYIRTHARTQFKVSKRISNDLRRVCGVLPENVFTDTSGGTYYLAFYSYEITSWQTWKANNYDYTEATFGPYDVNSNYYPSWSGPDRIVVMKKPAGEIFETLRGSWRIEIERDAGCFGNQIHWATGGEAPAGARWIIHIPADGSYEVYAWWPQSSNRATNTPYAIEHADGVDTVRVNQRENGRRWNSLGVYRFAGGRPAVVTITNDADGCVIADAIRLVPRGDLGAQSGAGGSASEIIGDDEDFPF